MSSNYRQAVWQNAATGGGSGAYVRVGAGYENSGTGGGSDKVYPYGHFVEGNQLYVATAYGLREPTADTMAAGVLYNQLFQLPLATPEQREKRDADLRTLERQLRAGDMLSSDWAVLLDAVRARYGLSG